MTADTAVADAMVSLITEVLGVEREQVTPEARWVADLGGESLDLLDLAFHAEGHFGVKVPINTIITRDDFDEHGRLSSTAIERLRREYPDVDFSASIRAGRATGLLDIVTVGLLTAFVQKQIATGQPRRPRIIVQSQFMMTR